jgi:hypothetical protein
LQNGRGIEHFAAFIFEFHFVILTLDFQSLILHYI